MSTKLMQPRGILKEITFQPNMISRKVKISMIMVGFNLNKELANFTEAIERQFTTEETLRLLNKKFQKHLNNFLHA